MTERSAGRARRPAFTQRLSLRIYVALVVSLCVAAVLFGMAHMRYGALPVRGPAAWHVLLLAIAMVVALVAYPVVRRLTRRLERLQVSVDAWGAGDLGARVAVEGRDEVAQLAIAFNRSAERVEALVRAQKSLLANASHELRSPLARIRMAVELIERDAPESIRTELARNIAELDQLVGELLLASRLDAGVGDAPADIQVDFTALVAEECARTAADCSVEAVEIEGDPTLLRRMVRNLLENAQRHGGGGVALKLERSSPSEILLEVKDEGPGVPEEEREAIFQPFYRARGASEADGGYGLGLSLVQQIARRHGGEVRCVGRAGGGCAFRVTLPRRSG